MSTMPPSMPPPPAAPVKKTSPLVWILGGIVVLMFGCLLTCGVIGFFAVRAVKNAGFDPDLMQKNPGLALTKMAVAINPNLETVSTNERTGKIVMREKSSGKIVTFKFDPDQKKLVMTGDDGKDVTITASGDGKNGSVDMQSSEGTMHFGAGGASKAPAWVPVYPGSSPEGTYSAQTPQGNQDTFTFKTTDTAAKVITYYQDQLKGAGFSITQTVTSEQGGMVAAEDQDKKRTVVITIGTSGDGVQGSVMAVEKK